MTTWLINAELSLMSRMSEWMQPGFCQSHGSEHKHPLSISEIETECDPVQAHCLLPQEEIVASCFSWWWLLFAFCFFFSSQWSVIDSIKGLGIWLEWLHPGNTLVSATVRDLSLFHHFEVLSFHSIDPLCLTLFPFSDPFEDEEGRCRPNINMSQYYVFFSYCPTQSFFQN